jgi:tetratricopeptide (TPR) repeat protein
MRLCGRKLKVSLFSVGYIILLSAANPAVYAGNQNRETFQAAEALLQKKQFTAALARYEEVLTREPSFVAAYRGLIQCYASLGDPEGGSAFVESLYIENPDNAGINYGMGYALYRLGKYQQAASFFKRATELNPDLAEAWNNLAVIYHFVDRDYEKAREYYEKAIELGRCSHNKRVIDIAGENLAHLPREKVITPITDDLSLEDFLNRFIAFAEEGNKDKLQALVLGQRDNCQLAMDWLMQQVQKARSRQDEKSESGALTIARLLAGQYHQSFQSDDLSEKLDLYQGPTRQ